MHLYPLIVMGKLGQCSQMHIKKDGRNHEVPKFGTQRYERGMMFAGMTLGYKSVSESSFLYTYASILGVFINT